MRTHNTHGCQVLVHTSLGLGIDLLGYGLKQFGILFHDLHNLLTLSFRKVLELCLEGMLHQKVLHMWGSVSQGIKSFISNGFMV